MGRIVEYRIGRGAVAAFPEETDIARRFVVKQRRAWLDRRHRVNRGRQRVVIDDDGIGGVDSLCNGFGYHEGHRVADMANLAFGQDRMWRQRLDRSVGLGCGCHAFDRPEPLSPDIGGRVYRQNARLAERRPRIDTDDTGMGMRRAQNMADGAPVGIDIGRVTARARQQASVLNPSQRLPNSEFRHAP
jgi:hypothetical protein